MAISQLNQRRLETFKRNRRGHWSFWIFMVLFILSLGAEFIANDKPIYVPVSYTHLTLPTILLV